MVSGYFANRFVKSKGFKGLGEFVTNYIHNSRLADKVEPEQLQIILSDKNLGYIEKKRQEGLDRGIQINAGDTYVKCELLSQGDTINGELRLKGHMTDHLEGEKWSFRVKTKDEYKGMYRFSLQHPGTRNYVYEWVYHELLRAEGIMALKYDFIHLNLNERDLGIYAIEEHFGQHVPKDNNRPKGALLRWNPELYWDWRINQLDGVYADNQNGENAVSFVEPYDKGVVKKDSTLIETYLKGAFMLEEFRRGDKTTSEIFDVEKMAKFHAIIDLVGGHHSLDWSDIKFFYNSETGRIEPVGYESFSVQESYSLAGQRAPDQYGGDEFDYHNRLFSDSTFYDAYVSALFEICTAEYFDAFISSIQLELDKKLGVLAHEFPYIRFSFDSYFRNIELIQDNLSLPKPLHAFLQEGNDSLLVLSVTPVSDFPIVIQEIEIDNNEIINLKNPIYIPPRARDTYASYFDFSFTHTSSNVKNIILKCKIPGGKETFEVEVLELPSYEKLTPDGDHENHINHENYDLSWQNDTLAFFNSATILLDEIVTIEKGKTLLIYPGQEITFTATGKIVIEGSVKIYGSEDDPSIIILPELENEVIYMNKGVLYASNLIVKGGTATLARAFDSRLNFQHCTFADNEGELIRVKQSKVTFNDCHSGKLASWGYVENCTVDMFFCTAIYGKTFLKSSGSLVKLKESSIESFELGLSLNHLSSFKMWQSTIDGVALVSELDNASTFDTFGSYIINSELGFILDADSYSEATSSYTLYRTELDVENELKPS